MNPYKMSPQKIKDELDKVVSGQDEAKKVLSILAYNHSIRMFHAINKFNFVEPPRLTGLITGPTGTGKTLLAQTLAKILGLPFLRIDTSQLSNHGFVGNDLTDYLKQYITKYDNYLERDFMRFGIIFIDEIDKIGSKLETTSTNDWHGSLQDSLLPFIDGTEIAMDSRGSGTSVFDTSKCLFILAGAFEPVYQKRRTNNTNIGFKGTLANDINEKNKQVEYVTPLTRDEMELTGLKRELIGRISITTQTNPLSKEEVKTALVNVNDNIMSQYETLFYLSGIDHGTKDAEIDAIVEKVYNEKYGMRYAKTIIFEHFKDKIATLSGLSTSHMDKKDDLSNNLAVYEDLPVDPNDIYLLVDEDFKL